MASATRRAVRANLHCTASFCDHGRVTTGLRERKKLATRLRPARGRAPARRRARPGRACRSTTSPTGPTSPRARSSTTSRPRTTPSSASTRTRSPQQVDGLPGPAGRRVAGRRRCAPSPAPRPTRWPTDTELWPLRLQVIDAHPALLAPARRRRSARRERVAGRRHRRAHRHAGRRRRLPDPAGRGAAGVAMRTAAAPLARQRLHRLAPRPRRRGLGPARRRPAGPALTT